MKKIIYAAIAAIGLWLSPGCSNEEELLGSGDEAQVSFTVNLADGIQTKAIADGTTARNLVVGVFEKVGDSYQEINGIERKTATFGNDLKTNVSFKLMKGKQYSFIFWAQSGDVTNSRTTAGSPYDLRDLQDIKVSYTGATANDESRDAFLGVVKDYPVTGNFTKDVELKRPFAQLNFMVTKGELDKAIAAGLTIEKSSITLSQVASKLQPLKGTVSDYQENVTFAAANVSIDMSNITASANKQTLPKYDGTTDTDTYYYLATTYFLVAAGTTDAENSGKDRATLTSANMKIDRAEGNGLTANSVPVQWNYRTNIYGPLLTAPGTFNVEIKEGFVGDYNEYQESVTVNTINGVAAAIQNGATTITVKDAPTSDETIEIPQVADGDHKNITLNLPALTSTVTISQASDEDAGTTSPKKVNVNTTSATNVVINLPEATVTLNGGTYTTVTSTTADETLIVSEGVTITNLEVQKGKVRIMKDGKVGTITRATGNQDAKTYVYIEDGGILNNYPATGQNIVVRQSISTAEGLIAFEKAVNGGNTYAGQTVVLNADIDLNGVSWTPVGQTGATQFMGTFDGQGFTISNLKINNTDDGKHCSTGLFGWLNSATVKNIKVNTAKVTGHHNVGVIAGYMETSGCTIENCHVTNATISCASANSEANGDKCGGIVGYAGNGDVKVNNCTVKSSTISAGRDAGQVVGAAKTVNVTNCSAETVTVTANGTSTGANIREEVIGRVL